MLASPLNEILVDKRPEVGLSIAEKRRTHPCTRSKVHLLSKGMNKFHSTLKLNMNSRVIS